MTFKKNLEQVLDQKLRSALTVDFLQLENESHLHAGNNPESHFKLTLVTQAFSGLSKVKRHQLVYQILAEEMGRFHALALHTFAPDEWEEAIPASTLCRGGH